jgi:CheY-like chemotaxis protein
VADIFSRTQDLNERVQELSLTITQWRVLFAINEETSFSEIKRFVDEDEKNIRSALQSLISMNLVMGEEGMQMAAASDLKSEEKIASKVAEKAPEPPKIVPPVVNEIEPEIEEVEEDEIDFKDESISEQIKPEIPLPPKEEPVKAVEEVKVADPKPAPTPASVAQASSGSSSGKVMVADQSIVIRKMIEGALEDSNIDVVGYSKAADVLANLSTQNPDILIYDIGLPDSGGFDLLKKVKEFKAIPVLIFSNKNAPVDTEKAEQAGANGFVGKPFNDAELVEQIKNLLIK